MSDGSSGPYTIAPIEEAFDPGHLRTEDLQVRAAELRDAPAIAQLLNRYATQGLVLPRTEQEIAACVSEFCVCVREDLLVACGALHQYTPQLAEIRSLAVREGCQRHGIGARLVEWCTDRAVALGIARVFVLTYRARFFERLEFVRIDRTQLPEKIWGDCMRCPKAQFCDEIALARDVIPTPKGRLGA